MGRTANRIEIYVDEDDYVPAKSSRQERRSTRHKQKEQFKNIVRNADFLTDDDYEEFYDSTLDRRH